MRGHQQQLCKSRGDWYLTDVNPQDEHKLRKVTKALDFTEYMVLSQSSHCYHESSLSSIT